MKKKDHLIKIIENSDIPEKDKEELIKNLNKLDIKSFIESLVGVLKISKDLIDLFIGK
jgi:hypothetical protein